MDKIGNKRLKGKVKDVPRSEASEAGGAKSAKGGKAKGQWRRAKGAKHLSTAWNFSNPEFLTSQA